MNALFDAVIVGSSFAGSILGKILAKNGWRVAVVDRASHPRFAIGESSTPTADFLLAYLADRWQMPELRPLAAWGTWKETYPEITCGKKRGFTYFAHSPDRTFRNCPDHSTSLMVAASQTDYWSDTQWLRSDVDTFFARQSVASGCELFENVGIEDVCRDDSIWRVRIMDRGSEKNTRNLKARWLIDAGGGGDFSQRWLGNQRDDDWMKTQTASFFGHFTGVKGFADQLNPTSPIDPVSGFCADDSAQHHVAANGWMWMLRFDSGVTSVGIVQPTQFWKTIGTVSEGLQVWNRWIEQYPSIKELLSNAHPLEAGEGALRWSDRLSRCRRRAVGDGWLQLPTAYGFVDPLHSTGIAHALSGVLRIAELLVAEGTVDSSQSARWVAYDDQLRREIEWIDLLVGGCYRSLPSFPTFCAFAAWYFVAAIQFERAMARDPSLWSNGYLSCEINPMKEKARLSYQQLMSQSEESNIESIRRAIEPWNDVGLLTPVSGQRIPHTAPPKYSVRLNAKC
ncbi:MAG: tryptophan 7-halogenase [Planctomycetota bacterium]|nr:tryptophan 7-halogenase [Planctomycetota bacterium]